MADDIGRIPPEVAERLGYYVYLYVDPRDGKPFYVGKGQGQRALAHLGLQDESRKVATLRAIEAASMKPRLDILIHDLPDEHTALLVEAAVIDALGLGQLTNKVRGAGSTAHGREPLSELIAIYGAQPVEITDPVILIRINRLYRANMSADSLYDATRGTWKIGARRERARYAVAVHEGVVRAVFEIDSWHPAGTTAYTERDANTLRSDGRWEFTGHPAPDSIAARYIGGSVARYLPRGQQNPIVYVNC